MFRFIVKKTPVVTYLAFGVGSWLCTDLSNLSRVKWFQIRCGVFFLVSGGISTFLLEFGFGLELWLFLLIVPMAISPPSSHMSSSAGNKSQLFQRQKYSLTEMCSEPNATTKSVAVSNACLHRKFCFRSLRIWERKDGLQSHLDINKQEETRMQEPILHTPSFLIAQR